MHSLEAACNEAQNLIEKVESIGSGAGKNLKLNQSPTLAVPGPSWANGINNQPQSEPSRKPRVFNIRQRLRELYLEECRNAQPYPSVPLPLKNLKRGSRLLEKLVQRDNLNTLIVNLYPGNKGYSLSLRLQGKVPAALGNQAGRSQGSEPVIETMRWPYSDEELLRCIDNEEIPATLVDLLETNHSELFYQGCVIAEIRDYRLTFPLFSFETHHVLLKPTTQSIINDVNIISTSQDFSAEDRLSLESQIVLATAPPICLDPNPAVGILINNLHHKKQRLSTAPLRRTARKFSQVTVNRKRKLDQFTAHNSLQLYDFITRRKAKLRAANPGKQTKKTNEGVLPTPPPVPSEEMPPLQPPTVKPEVFKYAKQYEKSRETTDCSVHLIEEYILETERGQGRIYRIKLTILQRLSNLEYLGELYVDRDYKEGEKSGASCRFVLGSRVHANRYIQQFTEIFTEEGRKSVRITHVIPGQQHRVSYTRGMRERTAAAAATTTATTTTTTTNSITPPQGKPKAMQQTAVAAQGKQPTAIVNNTQNSASPQNANLQHILPNPQQITIPASHLEVAQAAGTINFNLNSQPLQKIHGQLSSGNANILSQNSNANSTIQINSVSHLTSLLTNSNVAAPPNVNVHQIQQGQNVIGIAGQALAQPVQNVGVNVQNIGISNPNLSNSAIQSILTNALSSNILGDESVTALQNGPVPAVNSIAPNAMSNSTPNTTVHHPPNQPQVPVTKPSRPMATNPAISALVTSLMNSAQQFQVQQAAQQAANNSNNSNPQSTSSSNASQTASSNTSQNPTILSLLNATTPLNISNNNVISTSQVNLNQSNQKLLTRKATLTNLLNSRLINQNLSAALNNNVNNPTLVVNNANAQPLRVTLSSLNQLMNASNQNPGGQNQILNIGNVNQTNSAGFTIATTQGSITIPTQTPNLTTQTFTISNANSQTFTITTPNPAQNQTYSLTAPSIGNLTQGQGQTFTLTQNPGASSQSFTLSPANTNNTGFTISPTQNSGTQPQTFTVLQPNQSLGSQSFTITAPVVTQGLNSQNQAFAIANSNLPNKTFQINNAGTTNQTFTITTPVVTVASQFVNCQSPGSSQNYSTQSPSQTFAINAPSPQTNTSNVFTVNSPVPNQVFTVNIPSPAPSQNQNFNPAFSNSQTNQSSKTLSTQNSVLINKNQTFTINANNQNFTVTTPILSNSNGSNSNGNSNPRVSTGRIAAQRRLSNALQQASQTSELNKLLSDKSDISESSRLSQALSESKKNDNSKLSQALTGNLDSSSGGSLHAASSSSNLGLSMPGLSALLAGTPSADNPIPGASNSSSLLERLTSSAPNAVAFTSPPPPMSITPQSPSISALSPNNQNINFQNSSFSSSPSSNAFNSVNSNSPLPNLTSPTVPNFTSSSPKNQVQFQGTSPNSKEGLGISSPLSSPPGAGPVSLNLQGLSLQSIPGLQNVQVSIPGLAVPISLSLNVSGQPGTQGVLMTSLPVAPTTNTTTTTSAATMVLTNSASNSNSGGVLSLPVAQIMTPGVKNPNQRTSTSTSMSVAQGTPQSIQLVSQLQRSTGRPGVNQIQGTKNVQPIASRGILNAQKNAINKTTTNSQISGNLANANIGNQVLTLAAQQQLQLALQKQAQIQSMQQCYTQQNQKRSISPSSFANKHRRRSSAADSNK